MKKTVIALSLVAASSWLAAAGTFTAGGKTSLDNTSCGVIASGQTATVNLSNGVSGAYDCNTTNAGVATYHSQGAGKVYSASSNGGKLSETAGSDISGAATAARDAS